MYFIELLKQSGGQSLELVLWALYFGFLISCALAIYEKRVIGKFVRTLLKKEALSPDKALSLPEIGYEKNPFIHTALRGKTALSSLVYMEGEELRYREDGSLLPAIRGKVDYKSDKVRFYIPDELRHRASVRYEQHGTHIMILVVGAILFGILVFALTKYLPDILTLITDFYEGI